MDVEWDAYQELLDGISAEIGDLSAVSSYPDLAARCEQSAALSGLGAGGHGINDLERELSGAYGQDQDTWLSLLRVVTSAVPATRFPGYEGWGDYFLRWDNAGSLVYATQKYAVDGAWLPVPGGESAAGEPASVGQGAASDLSWVTPQQQQQLAVLRDSRGDWRDWLPGQLDGMWTQWRDADADVLPGWLDQWMPTLVQAADPGPSAEPAATAGSELNMAEIQQLTITVITPVLEQVYQELGVLADQLGVSTDQLAAEFAQLTERHPDRVAAAILAGINNAG